MKEVKYSKETMQFIGYVAKRSGLTQEEVVEKVKKLFRGGRMSKHSTPLFT